MREVSLVCLVSKGVSNGRRLRVPSRAWLLLLVCSFAALLLHAQATRPIRGIVVDSQTGSPISRALVTSPDQRIAVLTDSEGRFTLNLRPNGQGQLTAQNALPLLARKPGYLRTAAPVSVVIDDTAQRDAEIHLKLTPEAIITGRVAVAGAETPAGVPVDLLHRQIQDGVGHWAPVQSKPANSRGEYRFADLEAGDYKLMTREWVEGGSILPTAGPPIAGRTIAGRTMTGYPPAFYGGATDLTSATLLHLRPGEKVQADIALRPQPYYPVSIPVANLAAGAMLYVGVGGPGELQGFSLDFNPNTLRIEGALPNGAYHVTASILGEVQATGATELTIAGGTMHAAPLSLIPHGEIPVLVREQFTSTSQDSGVVSTTGVPGRPLNIFLQPEDSAGPAATLRDPAKNDDKELVLENVQAGRYRVMVTPVRGYVAALSAGGVDLLREPLIVGPGGRSAPLEVTLRNDTASLSGSITGAPDANATAQSEVVLCLPLENQIATPQQVNVTADRTFTIPGLPPGQYLVLAFSGEDQREAQNLEFRNEEAMDRYKSKGAVVTLAPGQSAQVEVPLLLEEPE